MNTLIAVSIAPLGTGESVSKDVAKVVQVIEDSGLPNRTTAMFTEIEGEWDEVMATVKQAVAVLADRNLRVSVTLKADIRPGHTDTLHKKLESLNEKKNAE